MSGVTRVIGESASRRVSTDEHVVILAGIQGPPGVSSRFNWQGDWQFNVTYLADAAVLADDGYPYICLETSLNEAPPLNPDKWSKILDLTSEGISFDPGASDIAATNVQDALRELDSDLNDTNQALTAHAADADGAHAATAISTVPFTTHLAGNVQGVLAEIDEDLTDHVSDATAAHAASAVSVTPAGTIASTDVQAALEELDDDIQAGGPALTAHISSVTPDHVNFQEKTGWALSSAGAYDNSLSYDPSTRVVTITPTGATFDFWVKGVKFTKTGAQASSAHADVVGGYFIYYDASGVLTVSTTTWDLREAAPVCYVYYAGSGVGVGYEERHTIYRDAGLHAAMHNAVGTVVDGSTGFTLSGYVLNSATEANITPDLDSGAIRDEDIRSAIPAHVAASGYTVAYKSGAAGDFAFSTAVARPYLHDGGANYIQYNQFTGGAWQLTSAGGGNFVIYTLFLTPALNDTYRRLWIPGEAVYGTLALAQAAIGTIPSLGLLLAQEIVGIYQVIFQTASGYATTGRARIAQVSRLTTSRSSQTAGSPTVHNSLTGRSDADTHPASAITNTPAGTIAATTVQAALDELDSEKQAISAKGAANGYAGLDAGALVAAATLAPSPAATKALYGNQTWKTVVETIRAGGCVPLPASGKNFYVWRAPVACTVSAIYGIYAAGTSVVLNVRKNGSTTLRSSDITISTPDTWTDFGTLQNASLNAGDRLEIQVITVNGSVEQLSVQMEITP